MVTHLTSHEASIQDEKQTKPKLWIVTDPVERETALVSADSMVDAYAVYRAYKCGVDFYLWSDALEELLREDNRVQIRRFVDLRE